MPCLLYVLQVQVLQQHRVLPSYAVMLCIYRHRSRSTVIFARVSQALWVCCSLGIILQVLKRVAGVLQSYMQQNSSLNDVSQVHAAGLAAAAAAPSTSSSSSQTPTGQAVNRNSRSRSSSSSSEDAAAQVPRVMLLCGADLLATIAQPGVWRDPDIILRDHGVVCIFRQGTDVQALLDTPGTILHEYKENIILVEEPVANNVSSTKIRQLLAAGQPVRYLLPDSVIAYIKSHGLYT